MNSNGLAKLFLSLFCLAFALGEVGCQSSARKDEVGTPFYNEAHLDFAKWQRDSGCCQAKGSEIAIASGGRHSSQCGLEVHKLGGNIVDVALATAFCSAVERPQSLGLGGGGFLTLHLAGPKGGDFFVDFRETAPGRASRDMFLDKSGKVIPGLSEKGALSVATPGFVAGMQEIHKKWGKVAWKKVVDPSVRLAREGFALYPSLAAAMTKHKESFAKDEYLKAIFLKKDGEPWALGETFVQEDLAKTLETIARHGSAPFYSGAIAKKIATFVKANKGILDVADLRGYKVKFRSPIRGDYKELTYLSAPPPSAGGVILAEVFNVLAPFDLAKEASSPSGYAHLLAEVLKRAYADRSQFVGDPDFVKTKYEFMLEPRYADEVRKRINREKATPSVEIRPGHPPVNEIHGTMHLSVMDSKGNAASSTLTINDTFGAMLAVPGTGIILNDEMDDFSVKPGERNIYGLTGGDANAIVPYKRPVSSMMPTIILKAGKPILAVGGAGGSRIISSVIQVVLNDVGVFPGDVKRAVFAPRVHHQWLPDQLDLETGFSDDAKEKLKRLGHQTGPWAWKAQVQAAQSDGAGHLVAVFDPRDEGGVAAQ